MASVRCSLSSALNSRKVSHTFASAQSSRVTSSLSRQREVDDSNEKSNEFVVATDKTFCHDNFTRTDARTMSPHTAKQGYHHIGDQAARRPHISMCLHSFGALADMTPLNNLPIIVFSNVLKIDIFVDLQPFGCNLMRCIFEPSFWGLHGREGR